MIQGQSSISVVTICFNNLAELIDTCRSVDEQLTIPFEHIIVDGSSNNDIYEWLTKNMQPAYRKWKHERDEGISDAFNKGILIAQGDIIHLLNAGDHYTDKKVLTVVKDVFENHPEIMWTQSLYIQHRGNMDVLSGVAFDKKQLWKGMRTVAHPTMFIRKEVYERHGMYDKKLKIAMDYDLLVRIRDEHSFFIARPLVYFSPGGISSNQFRNGLQEVKASYRKYVGESSRQSLWQLRQTALHAFMKTGLGKAWFGWKNRSLRR